MLLQKSGRIKKTQIKKSTANKTPINTGYTINPPFNLRLIECAIMPCTLIIIIIEDMKNNVSSVFGENESLPKYNAAPDAKERIKIIQ
ncbi:MAG: hypothetical protein ACQETL_02670 [Bacteroidota bacterium]